MQNWLSGDPTKWSEGWYFQPHPVTSREERQAGDSINHHGQLLNQSCPNNEASIKILNEEVHSDYRLVNTSTYWKGGIPGKQMEALCPCQSRSCCCALLPQTLPTTAAESIPELVFLHAPGTSVLTYVQTQYHHMPLSTRALILICRWMSFSIQTSS